jgi:hypothetical protein
MIVHIDPHAVDFLHLDRYRKAHQQWSRRPVKVKGVKVRGVKAKRVKVKRRILLPALQTNFTL